MSKQRDTLERVGFRNCVIVLPSNSNFHGVVKETVMLINMASTELLSYKKSSTILKVTGKVARMTVQCPATYEYSNEDM